MPQCLDPGTPQRVGARVLCTKESLLQDPLAGRLVARLLKPRYQELRAVAQNAFCMVSAQSCPLGIGLGGFNQSLSLRAICRKNGFGAAHQLPPEFHSKDL